MRSVGRRIPTVPSRRMALAFYHNGAGLCRVDQPGNFTAQPWLDRRHAWQAPGSNIETLDASDIGPTFRRAIAHPLRPDPDYTVFPTLPPPDEHTYREAEIFRRRQCAPSRSFAIERL